MITGAPGRRILRTLLYMLNVSAFSSMAILSWLRYNNLFRRNTYRNIVAQIIFTGIDALPTITLLGLAAGFVFTFRLISIIVSLGATEELVSLLVNVICLGIGPFVAAIILINRTGSAIVVDIGNMKLHGEIDGLENLGIDIITYLVAPRLIGTAISQLAITVYFTTLILVSGVLLSGYLISSTHYEILNTIVTAFTPQLIGLFIIKNCLFGFAIAAISCYSGLSVRSSPTEVPQQATRAIVNCLICVFLIDGLIAMTILL